MAMDKKLKFILLGVAALIVLGIAIALAFFLGDDAKDDVITIGGTEYSKTSSSLFLGGRGLTAQDLQQLGEMPNLQQLYLENNQISDISFLQKLPNLSRLSLSGNPISSFAPLNSLKELTRLDLADTLMKDGDVAGLSGLTKLQELDLSLNQISSISVLSSMTQLQLLYLGQNQIRDISPLSGLKQLRELNLRYNDIRNISPLGGLTGLRELNISYNLFTDFSPLSEWTHLTRLEVQGNRIRSPQAKTLIAELPDCTVIHYAKGHVLNEDDVSIMDALEILKYLAEIDNSITGNPDAREAAIIVNDQELLIANPTIIDALEILKYLAGIENVVG